MPLWEDHVSGELKRNVYGAVFETWRSEVDSYWQRNSYFAAFETAALAGCWYVMDKGYFWSALAFAVLGMSSAYIWWHTSKAVHEYIAYWWRSLQFVEKKLSLAQDGLDFATRHTGSGFRFSTSKFVLGIPLLFIGAWVTMVVVSVYLKWFKPITP